MANLTKRDKLQKQAEEGKITASAYWAGLKSTFEKMTDEEKEQEFTKLSAATLGRKGGSMKSEKKTAASRENGKKGGKPRKENK